MPPSPEPQEATGQPQMGEADRALQGNLPRAPDAYTPTAGLNILAGIIAAAQTTDQAIATNEVATNPEICPCPDHAPAAHPSGSTDAPTSADARQGPTGLRESQPTNDRGESRNALRSESVVSSVGVILAAAQATDQAISQQVVAKSPEICPCPDHASAAPAQHSPGSSQSSNSAHRNVEASGPSSDGIRNGLWEATPVEPIRSSLDNIIAAAHVTEQAVAHQVIKSGPEICPCDTHGSAIQVQQVAESTQGAGSAKPSIVDSNSPSARLDSVNPSRFEPKIPLPGELLRIGSIVTPGEAPPVRSERGPSIKEMTATPPRAISQHNSSSRNGGVEAVAHLVSRSSSHSPGSKGSIRGTNSSASPAYRRSDSSVSKLPDRSRTGSTKAIPRILRRAHGGRQRIARVRRADFRKRVEFNRVRRLERRVYRQKSGRIQIVRSKERRQLTRTTAVRRPRISRLRVQNRNGRQIKLGRGTQRRAQSHRSIQKRMRLNSRNQNRSRVSIKQRALRYGKSIKQVSPRANNRIIKLRSSLKFSKYAKLNLQQRGITRSATYRQFRRLALATVRRILRIPRSTAIGRKAALMVRRAPISLLRTSQQLVRRFIKILPLRFNSRRESLRSGVHFNRQRVRFSVAHRAADRLRRLIAFFSRALKVRPIKRSPIWAREIFHSMGQKVGRKRNSRLVAMRDMLDQSDDAALAQSEDPHFIEELVVQEGTDHDERLDEQSEEGPDSDGLFLSTVKDGPKSHLETKSEWVQ